MEQIDLFKNGRYRIYYSVDKDMVFTDGIDEESIKLKEYYSNIKDKYYDRFLNLIGVDEKVLISKQLINKIKRYFAGVKYVSSELMDAYFSIDKYRKSIDKVFSDNNKMDKDILDKLQLNVMLISNKLVFSITSVQGYPAWYKSYLKSIIDLEDCNIDCLHSLLTYLNYYCEKQFEAQIDDDHITVD
jgi:hypothetical protein